MFFDKKRNLGKKNSNVQEIFKRYAYFPNLRKKELENHRYDTNVELSPRVIFI